MQYEGNRERDAVREKERIKGEGGSWVKVNLMQGPLYVKRGANCMKRERERDIQNIIRIPNVYYRDTAYLKTLNLSNDEKLNIFLLTSNQM